MKTSQCSYDAMAKAYCYMPLGKYKGMLIPKLILTQPHYVNWCLHEMTTDIGLQATQSMIYFMNIFDRKPFRTKCQGRPGCQEQVKYLAVQCTRRLTNPMYLCVHCMEKVKDYAFIETYKQALEFVENHCKSSTIEFSRIIADLGRGKGWHGHDKKTYYNVIKFFGLNSDYRH